MIPPMHSVYLDNNATTPVDPSVFEAMRPFLTDHFGNAASIHGFGQTARAAVEVGRQQVADLLGAEASEVVFTCGGTEADNAALKGIADTRDGRGGHIVTTRIEHPAILRTAEALEKSGIDVTYLAADESGIVSASQVEEALREDTFLVSVMWANNETGAIQPLPEICALCKERGIVTHTDAVQAAGKTVIDLVRVGVDLLSISAHKFHGPKGVGALYIRSGVQFSPSMLGGSHERGRRGGTENVPGIVGLGKACELAQKYMSDFNSRTRDLRDRLQARILDAIPQARVNGSITNRLPHVCNISFPGVEGESLLVALDFQGIAVSTGAACSSGSVNPSHVLTGMGLSSERIGSAIRFSLGRMTVEADIDYTLKVLPPLVHRMYEVSPLRRS